MVYTHCAICQDKEYTKVIFKESFNLKQIDERTFSARRTPDGMHYQIIKCVRCGLMFSNPIFETKKINLLYRKSLFDYEVESDYLKKTYGAYLKQLLSATQKKDLTLLEIGCGNGFFLEEAKRLGIGKVYGIEPSKYAIKKAAKWLKRSIRRDVLRKKLFPNDSFDVICCFHTFDHIVDPNQFLQITYGLLKKGGVAIFIVHDSSGLSVKLLGEKSPIFDIEHIYLFNRQNLSKIFDINKFKMIKTFDVKNTYPLLYWLRISPLPKILKLSISTILKILRIDKIPLSLRVGNIGVIARK